MHGALYIFIAAMLAALTASAPEQPGNFAAPGGAFARIESGQTTVVQNGFSISFFDESGALRSLELRSPCVIRPGKCGFSNRFIFMPDIGLGVAYKNGRWQPAGCAVFDHSGKAVREFSAAAGAFAENSSANGKYLRAKTAFFIDSSTVAIKTEHGTFLYDILRDATVLKKCGGKNPEHAPEGGGAFARIESGQTTVVQNGFSISFFDKNGARRNLELRSPCVIRPGKCGFSNRFIFMPDKGFGIVYRNGRPQPAGCAVFDHSGKAVREFSAAADAFAENNSASSGYFRAEAVFFIDSSTVAVKTEHGTFLYDILRDATVLKKCGGKNPEHAPGGNEHGTAPNEHGSADAEHAAAPESGASSGNEHAGFGGEHAGFGGAFDDGEAQPAAGGSREK